MIRFIIPVIYYFDLYKEQIYFIKTESLLFFTAYKKIKITGSM
ncbi:hypothetical protein [Methylomonas albis]|nr:hypothetical protein [Methylomonas albis]